MFLLILLLLVKTPHFSQPIPVLVGDNSPFFPNFPPGFTVVRLPMTSWSGLRTPRGQQWKEDLCWAETWISSNLVRPIFVPKTLDETWRNMEKQLTGMTGENSLEGSCTSKFLPFCLGEILLEDFWDDYPPMTWEIGA
jgi:hypothetical protein